MSGIVGIVNLDGAPVDRELLARMTKCLAFRGPDAQNIWIHKNTGFGHSLLRTTYESEREYQPLTLDGKIWIVADARVDARSDLIAKLKTQGCEVAADAADVELILHAYVVWQQNCVEHLLGDFAFGIWDAPRRQLFLARDHTGVKPLYYANIGSHLVFSNTLDCIRQDPHVSDRLNDLAVADFLLFDLNQDKATTTFADIQRIPPAHCAVWSESGLDVRRYWTLPINEPVYYRRLDDYVERFKQLLKTAVGDRLRTDRVGIFMSGGIDSPTLAATAHELLRDQASNSPVRAFTVAYDGYDEERYYAGLVAAKLETPIEFRGWTAETIAPQWHETNFHTPEPVPYPVGLSADRAHFGQMATHSRVAFYGEGPDNALCYEWSRYCSYFARRWRFGRLLYDLGCQAVLDPRLFAVAARRILMRPVDDRTDSSFPDWLNPDFEKYFQLRERWHEGQKRPFSPHPIRPVSHGSFDLPLWQSIFEGYDPASTGATLEVRHPFLDVRLLSYLLTVPTIPWCPRKYLLRRSMRGVLPEPVLRRPKAPLINDPWTERMLKCGQPPLIPDSMLNAYVDVNRVLRAPVGDQPRFWVDFRIRSLNYWLRNLRPAGHNSAHTPPYENQEDRSSEPIGQISS